MMWESPIYVYTEDDITRKITKEVEGYIITETKKVVPYINKEELIKALEYDRDQYEKGYADGRASATTHGHWVKMSDADGVFYACSECGEWHKEKSNYCPTCGTKMDEVEDV